MKLQTAALILGMISPIAMIVLYVYGQGKAKGHEVGRVAALEKIDKQLTNHITEIKVDIKEQSKSISLMGERLAKVEGKINGEI